MRKAIIVESNNLVELNDLLKKGWIVEEMQPFHGSCNNQFDVHYTEPMLVILMGI